METDRQDNALPRICISKCEAWDLFLTQFKKNFLLSYGVRSGVTLLPHLIRLIRSSSDVGLFEIILKSFGRHSIQFGLFIAAFFGSFAKIEDVLERVLTEKKGWSRERIQWIRSLLAGGIASLALIWERDPMTRWLFAQYSAARAAQCLFEHFKSKYEFGKKYGHHFYSLLFTLCSGQLVYTWVTRPHALDPDYDSFLLRVSGISRIQRNLLRDHNMDGLIDFDSIDSRLNLIKRPIEVGDQRLMILLRQCPKIIGCELLHPEQESCTFGVLEHWKDVFLMMFPVYFSLHTIPPFVFRFHRFIGDPLYSLKLCFQNTLRSSCFMSTFLLIESGMCCLQNWLYRIGLFTFDHPLFQFLFGFLGATSIFIEKESRRAELAMYVQFN